MAHKRRKLGNAKKRKKLAKVCETDRSVNEKYPDEVWLEILSRLPIKSLMISQCVCKRWSDIVDYLKNEIAINPKSVPMCGLVLRLPCNTYKYICTNTGEITELPKKHEVDEQISVISNSGYEKGLLADLVFNFSSLTKCMFSRSGYDKSNIYRIRFCFITGHDGLFLLSRGTEEEYNPLGIYKVVNPVTNEVYVVEADKLFNYELSWPGMIITFPTRPGSICEFIVVELYVLGKMINVYCSQTSRWESFPLKIYLGYQISNRCILTHIALVHGLHSFLYLMIGETNKVLALKFNGRKPPKLVDQYMFSLPRYVVGEYGDSMLWNCGGNLHFTEHTTINGWTINIWMHSRDYCSTKADLCAWIPLVNVSDSISRQIKGCVAVQVLACNPDVPVIYICLNSSSIFAYDLTRHTLIKIADIEIPPRSYYRIVQMDAQTKQLHIFKTFYVYGFSFKPCLSYLFN